jgi:hypothetical protein
MTGITLPFVSHGGWSLITSVFGMLGILFGLPHRKRPRASFERESVHMAGSSMFDNLAVDLQCSTRQLFPTCTGDVL